MVSKRRQTPRSGFTLVELLAVIAVIALLSSIILGTAGYMTKKADRSHCMAQLEQLKTALEEYRMEVGRYPAYTGSVNNVTFIDALSNNVPESAFVDLEFTDPWGQALQYESGQRFSYELYSIGPNGNLNTTDDIYSEKQY